jgi:hypothetical protein
VGRLTNDALIATSAGRLGIRVITANERDFTKLAEFHVFQSGGDRCLARFAVRIESQVGQKQHARLKACCKSLYVAAGPVSRILSADRNRQDGHSSRPRITARLKRPTRRFNAPSRHVPRANPKTSSLFGLAPCGVYPACRIAATAVRSYRTFSPLPHPASDLVTLR